MKEYRFGWIKPKEETTQLYSFNKSLIDLPEFIDLSPDIGNIYDQGSLGSCTSNVSAQLYKFENKNNLNIEPSRLFLYYCQRLRLGTVKSDSGSTMQEAIKVLKEVGVCREEFWPYDITKFRRRPTKKCYNDARNNKIKERIQIMVNVTEFKIALNLGHPIAFGFMVQEKILNLTKENSVLEYDSSGEFVGGHAVLCVGYDDNKQAFKILNSWGKEFGDDGYFWLPYNLLKPLDVSDAWIINC